MIKAEIVTIGDKEYNKTYSGSGFMIEKEGMQYSEAIAPVNSGRMYGETYTKIEE